MFDIDTLIASCVDCLGETDVPRAVRETLTRAARSPRAIADRMQPETAGITVLYHSEELTIVDVVWAPGMQIFPHDHRMWAAITIYAGREDNKFFRRSPDNRGLSRAHGRVLTAGDVLMLGESALHAVANPGSAPAGAIHVYGGDFINHQRSQWVPPDFVEEPYDAKLVANVFAEANTSWHG
jgi:predicted metal-dependent enzyme (double-stranded beta helix superfamily)